MLTHEQHKKGCEMWYQLMPIKEGSREETPESTVRLVFLLHPVASYFCFMSMKVPPHQMLYAHPGRSGHVEVSQGITAFRSRHVIWCDSDTLGFAGVF